MTPARQIGSETTVLSASLDEPGFAYAPRLNVQLTRGLEGGDLTANVSFPSLLGAGAGLTGRYYVTDHLTGNLQFQAGGLPEQTAVLGLVGVQSVPTGTGGWYVGGQLGAINGRPPDVLGTGTGAPNAEQVAAPVVGGSVGYGPVEIGSNWRMQIELEANAPLTEEDFDLDEIPFPATRLSVGLLRLFQ